MRGFFGSFTLVLFSAILFAQQLAIRGQVKDDSGAVIPGAKVELVGPDGLGHSTVSDAAGSYVFYNLAPGSYELQASAPNLSQTREVKIKLKTENQSVDLRLSISSVRQEVTVTDAPNASVSTASAENATALVLTGHDLDALSDDPDDLQADLQALAGPSAGPGGGSIFIDGFSGGELPPKSSIREIRINQNPFSPEYDKLGYGRIEILTKPGSDKYRATVNYNLGTKWWNSRNPYSAEKAPFLLNEFEGNGGGPLGKRASFLVDAQRNTVDNGSISNGVVLNPASLVATPFNSTIVSPQALSRVSPRVDYQLNDNNTLTFRYGITHASIQDAGVGALDLASRGYAEQYTNQTVQASDTMVLGNSINETRFQFYRAAITQTANLNTPLIEVLGSFNDGGSQLGHSADRQNSYELQNYISTVHGAHTLRYGVRLRGGTDDSVSPQNFNGYFIFGGGTPEPVLNAQNQPVLDANGNEVLAPISSIERYRRTLLFQQLGYSAAQIRALGGGATQFSLSAGLPELRVHQFDGAIFAGDEWRAKPNLTLNLGLRYEAQSNVHDWRDIAPRLGVAWAPAHPAKGGKAKTVIRAGFGMFYQRFDISSYLTARRFNGAIQQQYVVSNPGFFPTVPAASMLGQFQSPQVIEEISSRLRAPYIMQSAVTLEQQLPAKTTFALTYTNSHGLHQFVSNDINAPLPGTHNRSVAGSGVYPFGQPGAIFLMESAGVYNQNQIITNVNTRLSNASLFGFYVFNKALSNTDGFGTSPANPYSSAGEYGPAITDVRHRFTVGGSINFRWNIRLSPFVVAQTGMPFDITSGSDLYGTTLFNARPGLALDRTKPGLIATSYGLLDPNPPAGETLVGRNAGRGPAMVSLNLRVGKTIGFGGDRGGSKAANSGGGGILHPMAAAAGRGIGGLLGQSTTSRRYNLTISMSIRNLLNHTNSGPVIGDITSPLFGRATQISGTPNGEGFYETANNRRLELQLRFAF
jgi:hypothetical protein